MVVVGDGVVGDGRGVLGGSTAGGSGIRGSGRGLGTGRVVGTGDGRCGCGSPPSGSPGAVGGGRSGAGSPQLPPVNARQSPTTTSEVPARHVIPLTPPACAVVREFGRASSTQRRPSAPTHSDGGSSGRHQRRQVRRGYPSPAPPVAERQAGPRPATSTRSAPLDPIDGRFGNSPVPGPIRRTTRRSSPARSGPLYALPGLQPGGTHRREPPGLLQAQAGINDRPGVRGMAVHERLDWQRCEKM